MCYMKAERLVIDCVYISIKGSISDSYIGLNTAANSIAYAR